ncbi:MAG: hypothetical protein ILO36_03395, partial [Abditibacteriota bacterium]|nr:hypothetical protein [Abditibacteriota bacterium]
MTREEYARRYLENTKIAPPAAAAAILVFLAVIFGMPLYQVSRELASGGKAKEGEIIRLLPSRARAARVRSVCDAGKLFGSPEEIKEYQRSAEDAQYISKAARPWVQLFLTGALRTGNEKALTGSGGELFYSEEIYSLVREDTENAKTAAKEILALDRYLKSRGVTLVALPVPGKASVYPERFSRCFRSGGVPADRALSVISETLGREGCIVCDLSGPFMSNKNKELFLRGDTHWSEAGLSLAADELARLTGGRKPVPLIEVSVKNRGDIFDMLDLPESQ